MVNTYGHSRICFAMPRDGLLPQLFAQAHPRFRTPRKGPLVVAGIFPVAAMLLPVSILGDLVSLGVAVAFSIVAISVISLRKKQPQLERPFRVPLGGVRIGDAWIGTLPACELPLCLGAEPYVAYGDRHSRVGARVDATPAATPLPLAASADAKAQSPSRVPA